MELTEIRTHLDRIDTALVNLLAERMSFIPMVAKEKIKNNLKRYQPERETEILTNKRNLAIEKGLNPELVEELFRAVIKDAHRIEEDIMGS
jgi:chorismate mutase/prephenate dehydrogenase